MNAPLDRCLCCSLHQGAVVAGNYAIIAYGAALAIYIWWIVEAQGYVPVPAYILVALYLITFVVSVIFVLSLSVQKKTTVLFAWILMMSVFLLPECGFNMWVCIWTLGTSTSKGLGFLVFYILRAVVNIISMICVHALYTWWNIEKNASKQRVAQIWYGNQHPYYLWNPQMLTYPGYEPSMLHNGGDSYSPPPSRPPRKPKPIQVSAGHLIKHQVHAQINDVDRFSSPDPGTSIEICPDNFEDSDAPVSKDSALGTEPTNESLGKMTHRGAMTPKPMYAFGQWVTRPHHMAAHRPQAPLWRPFAAVPYSNLKALKAAHAQGVHAVPIPPPVSYPPHPYIQTRPGSQFRSHGPPGMYAPPLPNSTSAMFSNGIIPLYGTSKPRCCALTPYNPAAFHHRDSPTSPRGYRRRNYEVVSVPKNPVPPNTVYDYKRDVEPAFTNFIMRQKRGQLGSYRPKSLRGITEVLRAEALQHVYCPDDVKKNGGALVSKRIGIDQTIVSSNNNRNDNDHIKTVNYEAPSNPHNGVFYGRDVIEDWRTMM